MFRGLKFFYFLFMAKHVKIKNITMRLGLIECLVNTTQLVAARTIICRGQVSNLRLPTPTHLNCESPPLGYLIKKI